MNIRMTLLLSLALGAVPAAILAADKPAASSGQAELESMDENGDGALSAAEHAAGARQMFLKIDRDHDGLVTADEMKLAEQDRSRSVRNPKSPEQKIEMIDTNKDGCLSRDEHEAGAQQMFRAMDANRDGSLTAAEIDAGHRRLLQADDT